MKFLTEVSEKKETTEERIEETGKMVIYPEICTFTDDKEEGYNIDIYLPGVERNTINLKMGDDLLYIDGESERLRYKGSFGLCCKVIPEDTVATYREGLLRIHVPFKEEIPTVDIRID